MKRDPTFWNDQEKAKATIAERVKGLNSLLKPVRGPGPPGREPASDHRAGHEEAETDEFDDEIILAPPATRPRPRLHRFRVHGRCSAGRTITATRTCGSARRPRGGTEGVRLGRDADADVPDVGLNPRDSSCRDHRPRGRRRRAASRRRASTSARGNTPTATSAANRGSIAWVTHQPLPTRRARRHIVRYRLHRRPAGSRRHDRHRAQGR